MQPLTRVSGSLAGLEVERGSDFRDDLHFHLDGRPVFFKVSADDTLAFTEAMPITVIADEPCASKGAALHAMAVRDERNGTVYRFATATGWWHQSWWFQLLFIATMTLPPLFAQRPLDFWDWLSLALGAVVLPIAIALEVRARRRARALEQRLSDALEMR